MLDHGGLGGAATHARGPVVGRLPIASQTSPQAPGQLSPAKRGHLDLSRAGPLAWFCGGNGHKLDERWTDVAAACHGTCAKVGCVSDGKKRPEALRCLLLLGLQKVVVQRRDQPQLFGWLLGHTPTLYVEILPTDREHDLQRVEGGRLLKATGRTDSKADEIWVWGEEPGNGESSSGRRPSPSSEAHAVHELAFNVKTDTELTLRVLGTHTTMSQIELLGIARFHPDEDVIPTVGMHGTMTLPLVRNGKVRGSATLLVTLQCQGGPPLSAQLKAAAIHAHSFADSVPFGEDDGPPMPNPLPRTKSQGSRSVAERATSFSTSATSHDGQRTVSRGGLGAGSTSTAEPTQPPSTSQASDALRSVSRGGLWAASVETSEPTQSPATEQVPDGVREGPRGSVGRASSGPAEPTRPPSTGRASGVTAPTPPSTAPPPPSNSRGSAAAVSRGPTIPPVAIPAAAATGSSARDGSVSSRVRRHSVPDCVLPDSPGGTPSPPSWSQNEQPPRRESQRLPSDRPHSRAQQQPLGQTPRQQQQQQQAPLSSRSQQLSSRSQQLSSRSQQLNAGEVRLSVHSQPVTCCAAFPSGGRVVTGSSDKTAAIWTVDRGSSTASMLKHLRGHVGPVRSCAVFPDGGRVLTVADGNGAIVWSVDTGEQLVTLMGVRCCKIFPSGEKILASIGDQGSIFSSSGEKLAVLRGHADDISACVVFPNGDKVMTVSQDEDAIVWSGIGSTLRVLRGHSGAITSCAVFPSGDKAVTVSRDTTGIIWSTSGAGKEFGKKLCELRGHSAELTDCAVLPNGQAVLTVSQDGRGLLWNSTGARLAEFKGHSSGILSCAVLPSGEAVVTTSGDGTAAVWSCGGLHGRRMQEFKGHAGPVNACAILSDNQGDRVLTVSDDCSGIVWPLEF